MIVVDNFCLSKKDIILLKEYFDKLSDKKDNFNNKCLIFLIEFFMAFVDKPYLKGVLPGLFGFFDKK
jgi:hypothetical protein